MGKETHWWDEGESWEDKHNEIYHSRKLTLLWCYRDDLEMEESRNKISSVQSLSRVRLFATPWTAARQASLSITNSQSLLKLVSIESVMPSNHCPLWSSFPPAFNLSHRQGIFQLVHFFASGGQSIGVSASASVLPMNMQDWFPLGWTGWSSLQSKGLSRVFSNTTV